MLCMSSSPASIKRIESKTTEKSGDIVFCCHGNQSFDPTCSKTLCSLSPTPVTLHIKFDQVWPNGFRDIQVWKCGRRTTTDHLYTISSPRDLQLRWGSGELKLVTNSGHASVTVGVCTWMRKKSPSAGMDNRSKLVRCTDRAETDLVSICPRRPRPAVCYRRSKLLTNKLPWLAGGVHFVSLKSHSMIFLCRLHHPLSTNPKAPHKY